MEEYKSGDGIIFLPEFCISDSRCQTVLSTIFDPIDDCPLERNIVHTIISLNNFQVGLCREILLRGCERYANSDRADINIQIQANKPEEQRFELNPDHTHYIIVRDDTIHRTGINQYTLRFER